VAAGPEPAAVPEPAKSVSILLVDDHEDTLRAMSRLLRRLEHRVVTATCVQGAMRAANEQNFDLLISDVGLPDGTGLDLMRHLLGRQPIRGIALTGYGSDNDLRQTREAGFSAHLTKPIDFRELETAIQSVSQGFN
jgi:CheY-like chemotaxis protein